MPRKSDHLTMMPVLRDSVDCPVSSVERQEEAYLGPPKRNIAVVVDESIIVAALSCCYGADVMVDSRPDTQGRQPHIVCFVV